jgi:phage terminase large subunit-like protein
MTAPPDGPARRERRLSLAEVDRDTRTWVRNAADELAARDGCRFDEARGRFTVEWIEDYCTLYEGDSAGQPMTLHDWQLDCTLRMFGWVRWSDKWGRLIRRFREADIYICKKNGKSPTLAAWGLYLLCGDGEPGQKVFLAAKDGKQARDIAGQHAMAMVEQSPLLDFKQGGCCKINLNEASITHRPTRSVMAPLSSSTERTQESKEGLNGCVLVDETHVVDRAFVHRISRAHLSRSEPFFIKVSTAGNNPDSYGKDRFDYARLVEAGRAEDQGLFTALFAAPQDVTDAEIDADPVKYGRMANPAWGRLIDPEEFAEDYRKSRAQGIAEFIQFKMYRLDIWQRAANPWLRMSDWDAGRADLTEERLAGRKCWLGMDLSKTSDMTAVVACFEGDEPETYLLVPHFWLPEAAARANAKLVPFLAWAEHGHLTLTPGAVTDYGYVRTRIRDLAATFDVQGLYYDPTYAAQLTQQVSEGEYTPDGRVLVPGLGIERVEFPQRIVSLAGPTADFERLVLAGRLKHPGHPVLDWQAGHATVYRDANGNKRPIKPKRDDVKKIDGIVAAIMALAGAMAGTGAERSVYNHQRLRTLGGSEDPPDRRPAPLPRPHPDGEGEGGPAADPEGEAGTETGGPDGPLVVARDERQDPDPRAERWRRWAAGGDLDD